MVLERRSLQESAEEEDDEADVVAFADDITAMEKDTARLEGVIRVTVQELERTGLHVNTTKTQVIVLGRNSQQQYGVRVDGEVIRMSESIKTVGHELYRNLRTPDESMETKINQAVARSRRKAGSNRATPREMAIFFNAWGLGAVHHLLATFAPVEEKKGWKPEKALRQAARACLSLPDQAPSRWVMCETEWLTLHQRALQARERLLSDALKDPMGAGLLWRVIRIQMHAHDDGRTRTRNMQRILRIFPSMIEQRERLTGAPTPLTPGWERRGRVDMECTLNRAMLQEASRAQWTAGGDFSPIRALHTGQPNTKPKWTSYVRRNRGGKILARLRAGMMPWVAKEVAEQEGEDDEDMGVAVWECPHCHEEIEDPVRHILSCPGASGIWTPFLDRWVHPLGIEVVSEAERLAIMLGEAPHRCDVAMGDDGERAARWRQLFHTDRGRRKQYWDGVAELDSKLFPDGCIRWV